MAAKNKRTIYLGLDYRDFTGGVSEVNRKMGLLDAEFKRATAEAKNYGTETDQLAIKEDYLTQKIALQNQKVEEAKKAYDAAMSSQNASAKEIDALDKKLLEERTRLEQLNGELKETYNKSVKLDEVNKKLNDSFKEVAIAAGAVLTILTKWAVDTSNTADELKTLSAQTGLTTTEIQRLQYAARFVDTEFSTMMGSITKLETNMNKAREGSKEMAEAFRKLHVRITDSNGGLRDAKEVFYDTIDALGKIKNETELDVVAMELFGKSAKDLKPLIESGSKALKEYGDEAERTNKIMSEEEVEAASKSNDSMQRLAATIDRIKQLLGEALLPILEDVADILSEIDIKDALTKAAIIGIIALVIKMAFSISALTTAMAAQTGIQTVFNAVSLKTIAVIAAIILGIGLLVYLIEKLQGKTDEAKKGIKEIEDFANRAMEKVSAAVDTTNSTSRHASGTDYYQGGKTWVGEEGPEVVELPRGSKIIPNSKAGQIGGTTNNYYITIDAKNVQDFNHVVELAKQMPMAARRV